MDITVYLTPGFNLSSTLSFLDPFLTLNRLDTEKRYAVTYAASQTGPVASLQGPDLDAEDVDLLKSASDIVVVSTSQNPTAACGAPLAKHLRYWQRQEHLIVGLETGAFALADGGFLDGPAAVHPSYASSFEATYPSATRTDALFTTEGTTRSCAGGAAALDMALAILAENHAPDLVRAVRDHLLAPDPREGAQAVTGGAAAPLADGLPAPLKTAIERMRGALDQAISVPSLAGETGLSQRQLERLFKYHTGRSPNQYYRMLRLDRARQMVTRSARPMPEIASACGFQSPVHFSRAYKEQFGRPPMRDRVRSRVG